ncbi:MAG: serine hydrolase [Rhizobiales bacterium]|nr:serine hydrolase [Hyphomicrobiales bacterium]
MACPERTANPDLAVGDGNKQRWNQPAHRRHGFHNAHRLFRQSIQMRAASVLQLRKTTDGAIASHPEVRRLEELPTLSALVVARHDAILHECYAPDFAPDQPHSIQSITKMHANLLLGELIAEGVIDPQRPVGAYLPDVASGYRRASVQMLLDMAVANDFTEDYEDPFCDAYAYEVSLGWRLPPAGRDEPSLRTYLASITGAESVVPRLEVAYKSANTDVLAWLVDEVTGGGLRERLRRIVEAAGYEGCFHLSTDREGFPALSGGGCLTARDVARFGLLFARSGDGLGVPSVGDAGFISRARTRAAPAFAPPRQGLRYSSHLFTDGRWIGHGGYGGQFLLVDMETGTVALFLGVLENEAGYDMAYSASLIDALAAIARL